MFVPSLFADPGSQDHQELYLAQIDGITWALWMSELFIIIIATHCLAAGWSAYRWGILCNSQGYEDPAAATAFAKAARMQHLVRALIIAAAAMAFNEPSPPPVESMDRHPKLDLLKIQSTPLPSQCKNTHRGAYRNPTPAKCNRKLHIS